MLISELEQKLKELREKHGDCPVMIEITSPDDVLSTLDFKVIIGNPFSRSAKYLAIYGEND
jgi:hypothetical protein